MPINCGAFPETLLESEMFGYRKGAFTGANRDHGGVIREADGGTLFLDEITETTPAIQVKLLRFLQEGEVRPLGSNRAIKVDVRIIAATNKNLDREMEEGRFREDLFYRLNVIPLHVPPLRERREDIILLASTFLKRFSRAAGRELTLSPLSAQKLAGYPWPGNVRELENKMRQVSILATTNPVLPEEIDLGNHQGRELEARKRRPFREAKQAAIDEFERNYVIDLMMRHHGKSSTAAEEAGMDRKNLWRLLKKHGLSRESFKE